MDGQVEMISTSAGSLPRGNDNIPPLNKKGVVFNYELLKVSIATYIEWKIPSGVDLKRVSFPPE